MIHIIASVRVKAGMRSDYLEILKSGAVEVRGERGCMEYFPAIDIDAGLPPQVLDEDVVTIIERWEDVKALRDHLASPHMQAYREKVGGIVEGVSLKILREA